MYRRTSRFRTRRPSSMPETESRRELHSTLEKLDCGISMKKKAVMREKPVTIWSVQRKACLGALFFMYAMLVVPCIIDLVHNIISSTQLDKILRVLEETVDLHSSTVDTIHSFHCLFMNMDCEQEMLGLPSHRGHECPNENRLVDIITAIVKKQNQDNSSFDHGKNFSTESAFSSFTCAGTTFLDLHTTVVPKIGSVLVQSLKYVHASYSAFDVLIELYSHCIIEKHSDLHHLIHEINYVKGHLLSFFLNQKADESIAQLNLLLRATDDAIADGSHGTLCSNMMLQAYLKTVHEITNISHHHLQHLLRITQSEYKWTIIIQSMYFFVLLGIPLICLWHFIEFWRRLVLVQKFSQKYNTVSDQLMKEQLEFKSILSEVIPRSNFNEIMPEGSVLSMVSSVVGTDSRCEPVQVSFSDNEGSDESEDRERQIRKSRISMINRFKQKSNLMGTIHEAHSIYDKITKNMSCKHANPSISNEVTIFRSDIVGFSRILKHFTPSETVNLVSYLVKVFDERIQLYDVFVLGREVDSFTVVSGISLAQITRHASEIVNMALDLMSISSDLEFQAGPETKLRLRMGIHTGTAYSRQVGFPKPRYNISGELLEIVKKIVRNAQPNQIQVSESTYQLLCRHIAYNLGKSGYITTENNKNIRVYTLNGRRVSEDVTARDCPGRRTAWMPIQLEQKALYRFEAEENRYFAPLNWMIPRDCSHSMASGSSSSSFSNAPGASRPNSISRPFRMSTQGTLNETVGF